MWSGVVFALAAGLPWGLMFVAPLLPPEYPAALLVVGRYIAYGLAVRPLPGPRLARADGLEALWLVAVGNLLYCLCLAGAIQHAGGPLPTMINGALPSGDRRRRQPGANAAVTAAVWAARAAPGAEQARRIVDNAPVRS